MLWYVPAATPRTARSALLNAHKTQLRSACEYGTKYGRHAPAATQTYLALIHDKTSPRRRPKLKLRQQWQHVFRVKTARSHAERGPLPCPLISSRSSRNPTGTRRIPPGSRSVRTGFPLRKARTARLTSEGGPLPSTSLVN
jgi:hypothetical protein